MNFIMHFNRFYARLSREPRFTSRHIKYRSSYMGMSESTFYRATKKQQSKKSK